jgi:hypothetical protein
VDDNEKKVQTLKRNISTTPDYRRNAFANDVASLRKVTKSKMTMSKLIEIYEKQYQPSADWVADLQFATAAEAFIYLIPEAVQVIPKKGKGRLYKVTPVRGNGGSSISEARAVSPAIAVSVAAANPTKTFLSKHARAALAAKTDMETGRRPTDGNIANTTPAVPQFGIGMRCSVCGYDQTPNGVVCHGCGTEKQPSFDEGVGITGNNQAQHVGTETFGIDATILDDLLKPENRRMSTDFLAEPAHRRLGSAADSPDPDSPPASDVTSSETSSRLSDIQPKALISDPRRRPSAVHADSRGMDAEGNLWLEIWSAKKNRFYYDNRKSGKEHQSVWSKPKGWIISATHVSTSQRTSLVVDRRRTSLPVAVHSAPSYTAPSYTATSEFNFDYGPPSLDGGALNATPPTFPPPLSTRPIPYSTLNQQQQLIPKITHPGVIRKRNTVTSATPSYVATGGSNADPRRKLPVAGILKRSALASDLASSAIPLNKGGAFSHEVSASADYGDPPKRSGTSGAGGALSSAVSSRALAAHPSKGAGSGTFATNGGVRPYASLSRTERTDAKELYAIVRKDPAARDSHDYNQRKLIQSYNEELKRIVERKQLAAKAPLCDCKGGTATVHCNECALNYCDACNDDHHKRGVRCRLPFPIQTGRIRCMLVHSTHALYYTSAFIVHLGTIPTKQLLTFDHPLGGHTGTERSPSCAVGQDRKVSHE